MESILKEKIKRESMYIMEDLFGENGYAKPVYGGTDEEWGKMSIEEKYNYFLDIEDLPNGISYDMGIIRGLQISFSLV